MERRPGLENGEEEDGDVVAAAVEVGGFDEGGAGSVEIGLGGGTGGEFAAEDVREGFVVELAGEAVGAKEVDVAGFRAEAVGVGLDAGVGADGAGDVVAHGGDGGFVGGDLAGLELLFDEGVVVRELLEGAGAEAVAAAVADVGEEEIGWGDGAWFGGARDGVGDLKGRREERRNVEESNEGGAHAGLVGDFDGVLVDDSVGGVDGGLEAYLRFDVGGGRGSEMGEEGAGGEAAGDFAGGGTAHAIADDEGADLGGEGAGVFITAARATDIGQHGVDEVVGGHGLRR